MFSFFKKKDPFTPQENELIVSAIRSCEKKTSGEIRVYVETHNPLVDTLERAAVIFTNLKMQLTANRNAVLLYIAIKDREVALFGDSGIHEKVGEAYWNSAVQGMLAKFRNNNLAEGIAECVCQVGNTLQEKFPYNPAEDKNELPDEIVFGK